MRYSYGRALLWLGLYVVLALLPLAAMLAGPLPQGRGFWVEMGVGLGYLGLAMFCLQFLVTGRYRNFAVGFGSDNLLQFHLAAGVVATVLVLVHPTMVILGDRFYLSFLDPRVNFMRSFSLIAAILGAVFVVVTSLWRRKVRLIYEWWRLSHGVVAFLVVLVGLVHTLQVSHFTSLWWQQGLVVVYCVGAMGLVVHTRVVKPWILKRYPYRVTEVIRERAEAVTLVVEAEDHEGMAFRAGQYAWMTLGDSPYSLQQHPFSFASSAEEPQRQLFTAKPAGDFTESWKDIEVGTGVWLEGPYGAFTPRRRPEEGSIFEGSAFIAGGVGVTPIMSMLRTLADRGDQRPYLLIYANKNWEDVIFREELEELKERLNLEVVHVLEEPPEDWEGEEGFVDDDVLDRHLKRPYGMWFYYICGPEPMMDMVESILVGWKISRRRIMSERFEIV